MYRVVEESLEREFRNINRDVFNNILDQPRFEVNDRSGNSVAYCYDEDGGTVIGIARMFRTVDQFRGALCSQMIHLFQIQYLNREPDFGSTYMIWINNASAAGIMITGEVM